MLRILLWVLAVALLLIVLTVVAGPFLISAKPGEGLPSNAAAALPESRFVRIPFDGTSGLDLHYLEPARPLRADATPEAAPFLLLHGFTFNAWTWQPVFDVFSAHARTLAYDQVPYGLSAKPARGDWSGPSPYSKAAAIEQLDTAMTTLGIERAVLVGNSSGGTLALELALAHPERVEALILVAPWVYVTRPTFPEWVASLPQMRRLSLLIARKLGEDAALLELSYLDPATITAERRERFLIHRQVAAWDLAWGELLASSLHTPVTVSERLADVRVPVLVVTGETDRMVAPEDSRRVAEALPHASLVTLSGCGHVPHEECPEAFGQAVAAWLSQQGLGGPGAGRPDLDDALGRGG